VTGVPVQPPSRRSAGTSAASSHGCPATSAQLHRSMAIASLAAALSRPMPFHRSRTGREADALDPAADLALARRVQGDAVDRVLRQAADGQRRAPVTGRTAAAVELLHPAGRVEPQFGEGRSRMDTPITSTCRQQTLRQLPGAERDSVQHAAGVPPGRASVSTDPGR
jgi:hypothetical protein